MLLSQSNPKLGSLASLASLKRKKETVQVSEFLQISKLSLGKQFDQDLIEQTEKHSVHFLMNSTVLCEMTMINLKS